MSLSTSPAVAKAREAEQAAQKALDLAKAEVKKKIDELENNSKVLDQETQIKIDSLRESAKAETKKISEEVRALRYGNLPEHEATAAAWKRFDFLIKIEEERDQIHRDIYIRTVKEHASEASYKKALDDANEFIKSKYGEDLG